MNAMTKGCLAGTAVCFISHEGEVYPCGYLPALAGDLRKQPFAEIWANSAVFNELRDTSNLKGNAAAASSATFAWVAGRELSQLRAIISMRSRSAFISRRRKV